MIEVGIPMESRQFNRLYKYLNSLRCFPRLGIAVGTIESATLARLPGLLPAEPWVPLALPQLSSPVRDIPPWNLRFLQVERCWEQGVTGEGVRVGHLDTGVDGNHPALQGRVVEFRHFDLDGYPVDDAPIADANGHGHECGIARGRRNGHGNGDVSR